MKLRILSLLIIMPVIVSSQINAGKGIHFEDELTWEQILSKAKAENKYIFLDCYTTWCAPCKTMERNIYPLEVIGNYFNDKFISVKVQMDRTRQDKEKVKSWYAEADSLKNLYQVEAYPTYLFFSSEGKPLHRSAGAFDSDKFLSLAADALNPEKQSYTLEEKYTAEKRFDIKKMNDAGLKNMAISLKNSNPQLADKMILEYIRRLKDKKSFKENYNLISNFANNPEVNKIAIKYINNLSDEEMYGLFTKVNFNFISRFTNSSSDRGFKFIFGNVDKIDSLMNKEYEYKLWYGYMWINGIIRKEDVSPFVEKAGVAPDWNKLYESLRIKYNDYYAGINILLAKIDWYAAQKDWSNYTKQIVIYMDKFGADLQNSWYLNQYAWEIFKKSQKKEELAKALTWSNRAVLYAPTANWIDTYANLLYKLGKQNIAIMWEKIAIALDPNDKDIQTNLEKMNKGETTW